LMAKKERLIELLEEKRSALIARAITSPRLSEARLGYYVDLLAGYAFSSDGFTRDPTDVRLLRGVNVSPGYIRWDDTVYWPSSQLSDFEDFNLAVGDLVFGMD